MFSAEDRQFMAHALELAKQGLYTTTPNPRVGCVLVKVGKIVGEGFHSRAGDNHAEINALTVAGHHAQGSTAYVTLEPCCHHGRTPPCTQALIGAGVHRVIAAMSDPNPDIAGSGFRQLQEAGIEVKHGLMHEQAEELNIGFILRMRYKRPWIRCKLAASLDGKTALNNGQSQWITSIAARDDTQHWRARACAIMTGIGTVFADNPQLNVRNIVTPRQPLKVIVDSKLRIPVHAEILKSDSILIATAIPDKDKITQLKDNGVEIISLPGKNDQVDLAALIAELGRRQINEVHVEAGGKLSGALLQANLVDELLLYLAPCLLGNSARGMFEIPELISLQEKTSLQIKDVTSLPPDLRITARFVPHMDTRSYK